MSDSELRDHFAGLAMAAQIAALSPASSAKGKLFARLAYEYADAMMKERKDRQPTPRVS